MQMLRDSSSFPRQSIDTNDRYVKQLSMKRQGQKVAQPASKIGMQGRNISWIFCKLLDVILMHLDEEVLYDSLTGTSI